LCKSFTSGASASLKSFDADTYFEPHGTSLRMSDLGYSNQNQSKIDISLNSLHDYVNDLTKAILTPEPAYEKIGVKIDGRYRQLNANLLQIENEFYSPVRPKRVARSGEQPTAALRRDGIEYVEIRSLDINLFDPCGINQNTMRFVEAFLIYCLIEDSPKLDDESLGEIGQNHSGVAKHGRAPEFRLYRNGETVTLQAWASEILSNVLEVAKIIDNHEANERYADSVHLMQKLVDDPEETPSARVLADLKESQSSFSEFALALSKSHNDYFESITALKESRNAVFEEEVSQSLQRQRQIEAADEISLDEYLQRYFSRH